MGDVPHLSNPGFYYVRYAFGAIILLYLRFWCGIVTGAGDNMLCLSQNRSTTDPRQPERHSGSTPPANLYSQIGHGNISSQESSTQYSYRVYRLNTDITIRQFVLFIALEKPIHQNEEWVLFYQTNRNAEVCCQTHMTTTVIEKSPPVKRQSRTGGSISGFSLRSCTEGDS